MTAWGVAGAVWLASGVTYIVIRRSWNDTLSAFYRAFYSRPRPSCPDCGGPEHPPLWALVATVLLGLCVNVVTWPMGLWMLYVIYAGREPVMGPPAAPKPMVFVTEAQPSHWLFSKEWTAEDKLRLAVLMTHIFRDDFTAGRYGQMGRPNVQSLHELIVMEPAEIEQHRAEIEAMVRAYETHTDVGEVLAQVSQPD